MNSELKYDRGGGRTVTVCWYVVRRSFTPVSRLVRSLSSWSKDQTVNNWFVSLSPSYIISSSTTLNYSPSGPVCQILWLNEHIAR